MIYLQCKKSWHNFQNISRISRIIYRIFYSGSSFFCKKPVSWKEFWIQKICVMVSSWWSSFLLFDCHHFVLRLLLVLLLSFNTFCFVFGPAFPKKTKDPSLVQRHGNWSVNTLDLIKLQGKKTSVVEPNGTQKYIMVFSSLFLWREWSLYSSGWK